MSNNKRILYLSYEGMTDSLGQSQVLAYMEKLAANYSITIVSFEKKARFTKYQKEISDKCKQAGINWQPLFYTKNPPVLSTVYDTWKMWQKSKALLKKEKFDIVHCRSYITSLVGLKLKRTYGVKFIFDMRGFWIDERIEGGYWREDNRLYNLVIKYLRKKESNFYTEADAIVSLTKAAKNAIVEAGKADVGKIYIIPTCVNLDVFRPFDLSTREKVRKELGISPDRFALLYSGGYGANYDIDFLKKVFKRIKEKDPSACILILSKDGVTGLENDPIHSDVFSISLPYSKVSDYLMAGDIGIINYVNRFSVAGRSPTKLAEYWASGLPAISPKGVGDVDHLFSIYDRSGILYDENSEFSNSLKEILTVNKDLLRSYAVDYFSLGNGVEKYDNIYKYLTSY